MSLDLSAQFTQKTLNELYGTKGNEFLVGVATPLPHKQPMALFPATTAEAKGQKIGDGSLCDLHFSPGLVMSNFTPRNADMDDLEKPYVTKQLPTFLPDPTLKAMENAYEQELEKQNSFFEALEEAKREGDFRRRAYLRAKGFTDAEIAEVLRKKRTEEAQVALSEGEKVYNNGDIAFQYQVRDLAHAAINEREPIPESIEAAVSFIRRSKAQPDSLAGQLMMLNTEELRKYIKNNSDEDPKTSLVALRRQFAEVVRNPKPADRGAGHRA